MENFNHYPATQEQQQITRSAQEEKEMFRIVQKTIYPEASEEAIFLVLARCRLLNLDPLLKPFHIVPMWDSKAKAMRDQIMPSIDFYRTMAHRSGRFAMSEPEFGPIVSESFSGVRVDFPQWCAITITKIFPDGVSVSFTAKEFWLENYATRGGQQSNAPNYMWAKRPFAQLAKCTEAQVLRRAFPEVGAQVTFEEMEGKGDFIDHETGEVFNQTASAKPSVSLPKRKDIAEQTTEKIAEKPSEPAKTTKSKKEKPAEPQPELEMSELTAGEMNLLRQVLANQGVSFTEACEACNIVPRQRIEELSKVEFELLINYWKR